MLKFRANFDDASASFVEDFSFGARASPASVSGAGR
jgi:hypothetical protein